MGAPLFLVPTLPTGDLYTLDGPEGHHAATVMRLRPGEALLLSDGFGSTVEGTVAAVDKGAVRVSLGRVTEVPAPSPRLAVVQGIAKGDRGELAVQAMTEVGVDLIVPWSAARSVVQWRSDRGERSRQRWIDTAREAAKQARRAWLPVVTEAASTAAVADRLRAATGRLVLHEAASRPLSTVEVPETGEVVVVVGPEGGITPEELTTFEQAGAEIVRLGDSVLRTSTAGVAALAVLSARLGRW